jgi:Uma2 family endonuclease
MATPPTVPMSVEEYLSRNFEPRCEYLDGALVPKAVYDYIHSRLQLHLGAYLLTQEEKYGIRACPELHIEISPKRYRLPDMTALSGPLSNDRYPTSANPPLCTIEIASLEEPWPSLRGKLTDHLAIGVSTVVIADPYNRTVMVATQAEKVHELSAPLIVYIPVPDAGILQIDFDDLYRKL